MKELFEYYVYIKFLDGDEETIMEGFNDTKEAIFYLEETNKRNFHRSFSYLTLRNVEIELTTKVTDFNLTNK